MADGHELPIPHVTLLIDDGVRHCPPGNALHCNDLNNRGLNVAYEITCWPKAQAGKFTTGERQPYTFTPEPITLNLEEKRICAILRIDERDLHTFLRSWEVHPKPDNILRLYATTVRRVYKKEKITCTCEHEWHYLRGRGRPRRFCPLCGGELPGTGKQNPRLKGEH